MASMVSSVPYAHVEAEHVLVEAPDGLGHDLTALCLAILTSGSLLLLLTWTRRGVPTRRHRGGGQDVGGASIPRRPPDLLELCVSRT